MSPDDDTQVAAILRRILPDDSADRAALEKSVELAALAAEIRRR